MDGKSTVETLGVQRLVLNAFSRTMQRETHVLTHQPDLLWQQLYNRLQWEREEVTR